MKFKRFLILLFIICAASVFSQNLVPDSSFEKNKDIPTDFSGIGNSYSWTRPSMGTTDLFCIPDRKKKKYSMVGVPKNAMGFQFPHSGTCYAGFFLFSHGEYREYLQTPLLKPLEKGKTYCLSMYISLADYSSTYIDQIGFSFLSGERHFETSEVLDTLQPAYINVRALKEEVEKWHKVTGRYKANGTEKYLLIGSFRINKIKRTGFKFPKDLKTPINKASMRDAYYFIDDVSLVECEPLPEEEKAEPITMGIDTLKKGKPFVLENILFETGSAILKNASFASLDSLAEIMLRSTELSITINGHTDNAGDKKRNRKLSKERAEVVSLHLIKKGVNKKRIATHGYGDEKPLVANDTEENRALNRRVEIIFEK